jgi:cytochrome-b5 reductase
MAAFLRKLASSTPIAFAAQSKSSRTNFHLPFTAIAAISGGFSYLYYSSSPNLVTTFLPLLLIDPFLSF